MSEARLRSLIDALNALASAPAELTGPPERETVAGGRPMEPDMRACDDEEGDEP